MNAPDYATQIWPDQSGHEGCGAACIASVLLSAGWQSDPFDLYRQIQSETGKGVNFPTDWADLAATLERYSFHTQQWALWEECINALEHGNAVIALLDNAHLIPRAYPNSAGWNSHHWLRIYRVMAGNSHAYCYDPLCYMPQPNGTIYQGPTVYTTQSIRDGIRGTPYVISGIITSRAETNLQPHG